MLSIYIYPFYDWCNYHHQHEQMKMCEMKKKHFQSLYSLNFSLEKKLYKYSYLFFVNMVLSYSFQFFSFICLVLDEKTVKLQSIHKHPFDDDDHYILMATNK